MNGAAVEVDTESAHLPGSGGNSMVLLLTANVTAAANLADLSVQTIGQYYFDCNQDNDKTQDEGGNSNSNSNNNSPCGTMNAASATTLVAHPVGFQSKSPLTVQILGGSATSPAARLLHHRSAGDGATLKNATFDASGRVCFLATWNAGAGAGTATAPATPLPSTVAECAIIVAAAAAASDAALHTKYGAVGTSDRDLVDAIRSVVGWNTMYDPRIKVATPVSRSFGSFPYVRSKAPLATENLLENTDGGAPTPPPIRVLSARQPAASLIADGRSSDRYKVRNVVVGHFLLHPPCV